MAGTELRQGGAVRVGKGNLSSLDLCQGGGVWCKLLPDGSLHRGRMELGEGGFVDGGVYLMRVSGAI